VTALNQPIHSRIKCRVEFGFAGFASCPGNFFGL
jgi:hypothetical protein